MAAAMPTSSLDWCPVPWVCTQSNPSWSWPQPGCNLGESETSQIASQIFSFYLSVAAPKLVKSDPSTRYTLPVAGILINQLRPQANKNLVHKTLYELQSSTMPLSTVGPNQEQVSHQWDLICSSHLESTIAVCKTFDSHHWFLLTFFSGWTNAPRQSGLMYCAMSL